MEEEVIDAVMAAAAAEPQGRWTKDRQGFRDMDGDAEDGDDDVDAVMEAAAERSEARKHERKPEARGWAMKYNAHPLSSIRTQSA